MTLVYDKGRSSFMSQKSKSRRIPIHTASGIAAGAALGLLFGLMLLESVFIGPVVGAVVGAIVGMIWELQSRGERMV
jgi:uncharacterized membrane protein